MALKTCRPRELYQRLPVSLSGKIRTLPESCLNDSIGVFGRNRSIQTTLTCCCETVSWQGSRRHGHSHRQEKATANLVPLKFDSIHFHSFSIVTVISLSLCSLRLVTLQIQLSPAAERVHVPQVQIRTATCIIPSHIVRPRARIALAVDPYICIIQSLIR